MEQEWEARAGRKVEVSSSVEMLAAPIWTGIVVQHWLAQLRSYMHRLGCLFWVDLFLDMKKEQEYFEPATKLSPWTDELFEMSALGKNLVWHCVFHFTGQLPPYSISDQTLTRKKLCNLVLVPSPLPVCSNFFSSSDFTKYNELVFSFLK